MHLTRVLAPIEGDRFFIFDPTQWRQQSSERHHADERHPYDYDFVILTRRAVDKT